MNGTNLPHNSPNVDKIVVRTIATIQLLISLAGFPLILFSFNYGGASAYPTLFNGLLLYVCCGLVTAICLYSGLLLSRLLALAWHGVLIGYIFWALARQSSNRHSASGSTVLIILFSGLAVLYLTATSFPTIIGAAKNNPRSAQRALLGGLATTLILAALVVVLYRRSHSLAGLEAKLHSPNSKIRCVAARELGELGPAAKSALPTLKAMTDNTICDDHGEYFDDTDADIEKIGGVDALLDMMKTAGAWGRQTAAWHLRRSFTKYPERAAEIKRAFATGLSDQDSLVRQASVEALGDMGSRAADLLTEVQSLTSDPEAQVRESALLAVGEIRSSSRGVR